jgi:predicted GH43/DUF377 family glycosyl hydrolase
LEPTESYEQNRLTAGCEDARVVFVEPLGYYVMTYTAYGPLGPRVALARSTDLLRWQRIGPAKFTFMPQYRVDLDLYDNKDAFLFPRAVLDSHGQPALAMVHRPSNEQGGCQVLPAGVSDPRPGIWMSYCSVEAAQRDPSALLSWRDHQLVAVSQQPWEALKIGGGTPPVLTSHGWLTLFHGVAGKILQGETRQTQVHYSAGAMVLDVQDPRKVLYRSSEPILAPEVGEETAGVVPNVVFPTGVDLREGGRMDAYYGMADSSIGVATLSVPGTL